MQNESARDRRRRERLEAGLRWLERYRPLIDDSDAFFEALDQPPPIDLMAPSPRARRQLAALLESREISSTPVEFSDLHLRVHQQRSLGAIPEVVMGWAYPQGAVSAIPPMLLAPARDDRILDLCAAPGGKTILLDRLAEGRASILAGDPSSKRSGVTVGNLARSAVTSVLLVRQEGTTFPCPGRLNKILLDAPCSGEGTFRIPSPRYEPTGVAGLEAVSRVQRNLLARAASLLAPGGDLVYSTCAYSPEENEAVIDSLLRERDDMDLVALPEDTPGIPGVHRWLDQRFDERMKHARRILPHHTGSWGFFVAHLVKSVDSRHTARPRVRPGENYRPSFLEDDGRARSIVEDFFFDRFGVARDFWHDFRIPGHGKDIWLLGHDAREPFDVARLPIIAPGLRIVKMTGRGPRATSAAVRRLDAAITKCVIEIEWSEALELLEAGKIVVGGRCSRGGPTAIRCKDRILGLGFVADGEMQLEIPAAWR